MVLAIRLRSQEGLKSICHSIIVTVAVLLSSLGNTVLPSMQYDTTKILHVVCDTMNKLYLSPYIYIYIYT